MFAPKVCFILFCFFFAASNCLMSSRAHRFSNSSETSTSKYDLLADDKDAEYEVSDGLKVIGPGKLDVELQWPFDLTFKFYRTGCPDKVLVCFEAYLPDSGDDYNKNGDAAVICQPYDTSYCGFAVRFPAEKEAVFIIKDDRKWEMSDWGEVTMGKSAKVKNLFIDGTSSLPSCEPRVQSDRSVKLRVISASRSCPLIIKNAIVKPKPSTTTATTPSPSAEGPGSGADSKKSESSFDASAYWWLWLILAVVVAALALLAFIIWCQCFKKQSKPAPPVKPIRQCGENGSLDSIVGATPTPQKVESVASATPTPRTAQDKNDVPPPVLVVDGKNGSDTLKASDTDKKPAQVVADKKVEKVEECKAVTEAPEVLVKDEKMVAAPKHGLKVELPAVKKSVDAAAPAEAKKEAPKLRNQSIDNVTIEDEAPQEAQPRRLKKEWRPAPPPYHSVANVDADNYMYQPAIDPLSLLRIKRESRRRSEKSNK